MPPPSLQKPQTGTPLNSLPGWTPPSGLAGGCFQCSLFLPHGHFHSSGSCPSVLLGPSMCQRIWQEAGTQGDLRCSDLVMLQPLGGRWAGERREGVRDDFLMLGLSNRVGGGRRTMREGAGSMEGRSRDKFEATLSSGYQSLQSCLLCEAALCLSTFFLFTPPQLHRPGLAV